MDTCGRTDIAAIKSLQIVRQSNQTALLGVIALEDAEVLTEAARVLRRHRIPLVVATPKASEAVQLYSDDPTAFLEPDNVFSAVPNTAAVARVNFYLRIY